MTERIITRIMLERGDVRPDDRVLSRVTGEPTRYGTVVCVDLVSREFSIHWDDSSGFNERLDVWGFKDSEEEESKADVRIYLIDETDVKSLYTVLHYDTVKLRYANREEVKEFFATMTDPQSGWSVIEQQHIKPVKLTKRVVFDVDF